MLGKLLSSEKYACDQVKEGEAAKIVEAAKEKSEADGVCSE